MFYTGPILHYNYSKIMPYLFPEGSASVTRIAAKKALLDKFAFSPLVIVGFFIALNLVEGKGL